MIVGRLDNAGDIASLIGVVVSAIVLRQTFAIKKTFLRKVRVPELLKRSERLSQDLLDGLDPKAPPADSLGAICRIESVVRSLINKSNKQETGLANDLLQKCSEERKRLSAISAFPVQGSAQSAGWEIYSDLIVLIEAVRQGYEDSRFK
jgi:hypothetical protein